MQRLPDMVSSAGCLCVVCIGEFGSRRKPGQSEMDQWVQQQLQFYPHGLPPTPLVHSPKDYGLDFEEIVFPAYLDQVPIEGWYLRCEGSQKIIIANHPLTFNRAGSPGLPGFGGPVNLVSRTTFRPSLKG